jgi:Fe-S oxidoreductase
MPDVANFFMHAPVVSRFTKAIMGIAPQRKMPKYAKQTFKNWFGNRKIQIDTGRQKVILWADTFNNNFLPQTLVAGLEVLEAAGFEVVVPKKSLCCGRPLYDFGMLKTAKRMLLQILDELKEDISDGVPVVGLEPSCVAVFRDELINLFPHRKDAARLSKQVFTLGEFLQKKAQDFKIPTLRKKAIVHGHCHHKSIMKLDDEKEVLKRTGLDYEILQTTCCGMAGYFGYEKGDHYDVSIKAGELKLLPAVRDAAKDTIIITNGFSCREQIEQETDRKGMHLAQVLQMAMREQQGDKTGSFPERKYVDEMKLDGYRISHLPGKRDR